MHNNTPSQISEIAHFPEGHCLQCGTFHTAFELRADNTAHCPSCQSTLCVGHHHSFESAPALTIAALICLMSSMLFPFLTIEVSGRLNTISLTSLVSHFDYGFFYSLGAIIALSIFVLPLIYLSTLLYVLAPLTRNRAAFQGASRAFRFANHLRPWAMVEVFLIGTSVALIKVSEIADVTFNTGFWALFLASVFTFIIDQKICRMSVWSKLRQVF